MTTPLTLHTGHHPDGRPMLTARGEIDLSNLNAFIDAVSDLVAEATPAIVDLSAVEYLDSGAINALFTHAEKLHLIANSLLIRALTVSGLTELATVESID
jgi:anti-anti-sigma factor